MASMVARCGLPLALVLLVLATAPPRAQAGERELKRETAFTRLDLQDRLPPARARGVVAGTIVPVIAPGAPYVSTVGVRVNVAGTGTLISLIDPIGPAPGSSEYGFATVTGGWAIRTRLGGGRVVARGLAYDLAWGDFRPDATGGLGSTNLKSVTIPLDSPLRRQPDNHLLPKAAGRAVFALFARDFTIDGVPVRSVRLLLDRFDNPAIGFNMADDGTGAGFGATGYGALTTIQHPTAATAAAAPQNILTVVNHRIFPLTSSATRGSHPNNAQPRLNSQHSGWKTVRHRSHARPDARRTLAPQTVQRDSWVSIAM